MKFEINRLLSNLAIRNLLSDLLNRDVELFEGHPLPVGGAPGSLVGLYVDDHLKSKAVISRGQRNTHGMILLGR
ncbi:hypothetical protein OG218_01595 [Kineococcus sp. NBC_00420]|uniref:hypothetical protein n=1 Tax=Kineococcus sp. NBC_00420 TaxID=2903564 RepID=UPI002E1E6ED9